MKTNINIKRFLAISALSLAIPMVAIAGGNYQDRSCQDHHGMEMRHEQGMPELRGIDLSAEQVAQLSSMRDEQKKLFAGKHQEMRDQHDALRKLVMSDAYTPAAAAEIIAKIGAIQSEMAKLHAEQGNKLYKLLTPAQRTKMQQNELMEHGMMGHGRKH